MDRELCRFCFAFLIQPSLVKDAKKTTPRPFSLDVFVAPHFPCSARLFVILYPTPPPFPGVCSLCPQCATQHTHTHTHTRKNPTRPTPSSLPLWAFRSPPPPHTNTLLFAPPRLVSMGGSQSSLGIFSDIWTQVEGFVSPAELVWCREVCVQNHTHSNPRLQQTHTHTTPHHPVGLSNRQ